MEMRDCPAECGTVDTYAISAFIVQALCGYSYDTVLQFERQQYC